MTTKDEALRVAREEILKAGTVYADTAAFDQAVLTEKSRTNAADARLVFITTVDSALRTIALAVEAPSVRMLTPAEHFSINLKEPVRIADIEAVQRKFCEVNGLGIAASASGAVGETAPVEGWNWLRDRSTGELSVAWFWRGGPLHEWLFKASAPRPDLLIPNRWSEYAENRSCDALGPLVPPGLQGTSNGQENGNG